jgi:anti-anti-sigma factor
MAIESLQDKVIVVGLPKEPETGDELKKVTELVRDRGGCDVIIDFSSVDIVVSSSLSGLLELRKLVADLGRRLICCGVATSTRGIFTVTGLEPVFEFADDRSAGLQEIEAAGSRQEG